MAIEIVDLAIEDGDFSLFFVCLPEGEVVSLQLCCWLVVWNMAFIFPQ